MLDKEKGVINVLSINRSSYKDEPLREAVRWPSFDKFKNSGRQELDNLEVGEIATLLTKKGQFRLLVEEDFQRLYGLASDVERLMGGLSVVISAAQAVGKHNDDATIDVLVRAVSVLGHSPVLPTRSGHDPVVLEGVEQDEDDEVILDPNELYAQGAQEAQEQLAQP